MKHSIVVGVILLVLLSVCLTFISIDVEGESENYFEVEYKLNFDGHREYVEYPHANDHVYVQHHDSLNITENITIQATVEVDEIDFRAQEHTILERKDYRLAFNGDQNVSLLLRNQSHEVVILDFPHENLSLRETEYTYTAMYDFLNETIKLYVDDYLLGTKNFSGKLNTRIDGLRIGQRSENRHLFNGRMREVRLYDTYFDTNTPTELPLTGLVSHWEFNEGQGNITYDSVGENHGEIHGAEWGRITEVVKNILPDNHETVPTDFEKIEFDLYNYAGSLMDYNIETTPYIGSKSQSGVGNGTYNFTISEELVRFKDYKWFLNVTIDGEEINYEFDFHTGYTYTRKIVDSPVGTDAVSPSRTPNAQYVDSERKTFIIYAGDYNNPYAIYFDHEEKTFSDPFFIDENPLGSPSAHGNPAMIIDDDGYIYVVYGSHSSPINIKRSENPYDITNWTDRNRPDMPRGTYTSLAVYQNDLYIIYRPGGCDTDPSYPSHSHGTLMKSSDRGKTWQGVTRSDGMVVNLTDSPEDYEDFYIMDFERFDDNKLGFIFCLSKGVAHNANRTRIVSAYVDLDDGNLYDHTGENFGSHINYTEITSDNALSVYYAERGSVNWPRFIYYNETIHVTFQTMDWVDFEAFLMYGMLRNGTWELEQLEEIGDIEGNSEFRVDDAGNLELYASLDEWVGSSQYLRGGNLFLYKNHDGESFKNRVLKKTQTNTGEGVFGIASPLNNIDELPLLASGTIDSPNPVAYRWETGCEFYAIFNDEWFDFEEDGEESSDNDTGTGNGTGTTSPDATPNLLDIIVVMIFLIIVISVIYYTTCGGDSNRRRKK